MVRMLSLALGLFGVIIGSFLNVVILRHGVRGLDGRSACGRCGHALAWYDLVPVASWIMVRGRCRYCGSAISAQYPLVETATGLLFWGLSPVYALGPVALASAFVVVALLICIFVYDLHHTIIPDEWVFLAALASAVYAFTLLPLTGGYLIWIASGALIASVPLLALWAISGGRWMGFGDVKLAAVMGLLLGPVSGLFAVFFAFILGSLTLVPLMAYARVTHKVGEGSDPVGLTMKSEVPFGPFLVASTLIIWISLVYGYDIAAIAGW